MMNLFFIRYRGTQFFTFSLVLLPLLTLPSCFRQSPAESGTEILWDINGVPHIYGSTPEEMYYGFGWAQMENHADLILHLYGEARGRASEYWGKKYFESDKRILLFDIPEQADKNYNRMSSGYQPYLDAFVRGINQYAMEHPESIGEEVRQVLPVTPRDVIAHVLRVLCLEFIAYEDMNHIARMMPNGSNAYAIAPSRSATGNAMLVTNPHLPWWDFFLWFEAHLNSGDFNAYGISLVGMPTLSMAFNDHLGWALTVNPMDGADRYQLTLNKKGYMFDNVSREFETKTHTIKILQPGPAYRDSVITCKRSVHGPVIEVNDKTAMALRIVGLENARIFEQYHRMAASTRLDEFEEALKMLQNPMFNIIYADASGNILYVFNGNVPVRTSGDFAFWKGTLDGSRSALVWDRIHDYGDLPRVLNPAGGFIQNCNDPPWTCSFPPELDRKKFPAYMAPDFMHFRAQRATNMIIDDPSISFEELTAYKLNTGLETAERFLDDLLLAAATSPDSLSTAAAEVLRHWDKKTDPDSRGAVLFTRWFDLVSSGLFRQPWDPERPNLTPDGISDAGTAVRLLQEAARELVAVYGSLDVPWGEIHRFRMNGKDVPANGGPERYGIFRTIDYQGGGEHKKFAVSGDTYVAVIEFGEKVKAEVLLSYGNSSRPGHPHNGDQLELLAGKKLRPALLDREDILRNLEKSEILTGQ